VISEEELLTVYRDTIRPLYAFVARRARSGSRALVEDVVQETYLRAVRHWRRNGFPHNPLAWLQTVAANLVASHYRRRPTESLEQLDVDPADRSAKSLDACDTGFIPGVAQRPGPLSPPVSQAAARPEGIPGPGSP
jgi:DNA-directed RNA polymerase specialized sigma24 family protein